MNADSLIGHIVELIDLTGGNTAPADRVISTFFRQRHYLGSRDRRFVSEGLFGIVRNRRLIEALLEEYLRVRPEHSILDSRRVRSLALYAAYAVLSTDSQPSFPPPADSLWKRHFPETDLAGFSNWITANRQLDFLAGPDAGSKGGDPGLLRLAVEHSFQDWMVSDWHVQFGPDTERLLRTLNAPARVTLRVNLSRATRDQCRSRLLEEGMATNLTALSKAGLVAGKRFNAQASGAYKDGWFELQDEGSQLLSVIAAPKPGDIVLDACAGAGGKSLHLADIMEGKGKIFAADTDKKRLQELDLRSRRAGVSIIEAVTMKRPLPEPFSADLVLIDAPCTGVGTIRRNPDMKWRVTEESAARYPELQLGLLESNCGFLKENGVMMYATCSLLRKENEEVVATFLRNHPELQVVRPGPDDCPPSMITREGFVKILPYDADTDGFFAAKLTRSQDRGTNHGERSPWNAG